MADCRALELERGNHLCRFERVSLCAVVTRAGSRLMQGTLDLQLREPGGCFEHGDGSTGNAQA